MSKIKQLAKIFAEYAPKSIFVPFIYYTLARFGKEVSYHISYNFSIRLYDNE